MRKIIENAQRRWSTELLVLSAALLTLLIYFLRKRPETVAFNDLLGYWKFFLGLILLVVVLRIWTAAGRPSVVVMPFDIFVLSPPRGLTGIALSRLLFDEIKVSLEEGKQSLADELAQKGSYEPELPKAAQPAADLGPAVTLDYKGLSVDSVLNFTRRLRGTVAVITGELISDDPGIMIRCRCSIPALFGSGLSKPHRESTASPPESWKLRESVREVAKMLAGDLKRQACYELSSKQAGSMLLELGRRYSAAAAGGRFENLQEAIRCYDEALAIFSKESHPQEWGRTMNYRGNAYRVLLGPNRIRNLFEAIECYRGALRVFSKTADPRAWAGTTENLGLAFCQLPNPNRQDNLEQAIEYFDQALEVLNAPSGRDRIEWAKTSRNKADAIAALSRPDRIVGLSDALRMYKAVLDIFAKTNREEWAYTMSVIGNTNRQLPSPDHTDNLLTAVKCFDSALQVYTRTRYPIDWAQIMNQRGNACRDMLGPDRPASLREAISCYDQALGVFTRERYPAQWASTLNNKGIA